MQTKDYNELLSLAINGDLSAMRVVAMMYNVGYLLPKSREHALAWTAFSTMTVANMGYAEAIRDVKAHRRETLAATTDEGLLWPSQVMDNIFHALKSLDSVRTTKKCPAGSLITPVIKGMRMHVLYRATKVEGEWRSFLYGALIRVNGEYQILTVDKLAHLNIPRYLGEIRGNVTIPNYMPFGPETQMYVIEGTISVPTLLLNRMKRFFPNVSSYSQLWKTYLDSLNRQRLLEQTHVEADGKARKLSKKERKEERLSYKMYLKRLPESYLQFTATNLFVYTGKVLKTTKLLNHTHTHLQSLGFLTLKHPLVEFDAYSCTGRSKSELSNVLAKFKKAYPDLRIAGLFIRPDAESVKLSKCFVYSED
jgi:hypothetical protein